ncbi:MAG: very short patch repair endonuclease [Myxococcales bacterium]|nr:very short patch repair endonuclease [Myxococcales bacterium]
MARVKGTDTKPERIVRRQLSLLGFSPSEGIPLLPGKPDVVLMRFRLCVFVHGCFWHQHPGCRRATFPASNVDFWTAKLARTTERDAETLSKLAALGWNVLVLWECETRNEDTLCRKLLEAINVAGGTVEQTE